MTNKINVKQTSILLTLNYTSWQLIKKVCTLLFGKCISERYDAHQSDKAETNNKQHNETNKTPKCHQTMKCNILNEDLKLQ